MKKMWKKAIIMIWAGGFSVMCLAGCGKDASESPKTPTQETHQSNGADETQENQEKSDPTKQAAENNGADEASPDSVGEGAFYDGSNLQGSVVEFSEEGFTLSPATTKTDEGGGEVMEQAAPGSEKDEDNIQITYTDNTVFQIVNFSISTQSEISREDAAKENVKKLTSVCVFGSCEDARHWTADKILILRWQ